MEASRFGRLPGELRNKIYGFVFAGSGLELDKNDSKGNIVTLHAYIGSAQAHIFGILGTCKAMRCECLSLLAPSTLRVVVTPCGSQNEQLVRNTLNGCKQLVRYVQMFSHEQVAGLHSVECATVQTDSSVKIYHTSFSHRGGIWWTLWKAIQGMAPNAALDISMAFATNVDALDANNMTKFTLRLVDQEFAARSFFEPAFRQHGIARHQIARQTTVLLKWARVRRSLDNLLQQFADLLHEVHCSREDYMTIHGTY